MRVGFLIDRWQPERGGAERAMADLAAWLSARGHEPRAFAVRGTGAFDPVRAPLRLSRGGRERALGDALVAAADEAFCDVTLGIRHLPRVDLYWPHAGSHAAALRGWRSARAGRLLARSEVRAGGRHRTFLSMERALLEGGGARRVACVSNLVRIELASAYPSAADRLVLVRDGVDTDRFHPRERARAGARLRGDLGIDAATPILGFSARHPALKGLPVLLSALAGLAARPWQLLVAGPKDPAAWKKRARAAGIASERVHVLAEIDPVVLAAGSDIVLHPTWRDACGLVVLEALAAGTPVVTTALAGAAESVTSAEHGTVLEDPSDIPALRTAIAGSLDRILARAVDRDTVRSAVAGRDRTAWFFALESILLDLAAHPHV